MKQDTSLKRWDNLIKSGQAAMVKNELRKINSKQLLRPLLFSYCDMARRVGSPELIIRWLRPIVRSPKPMQAQATQPELAIYALGLLRLCAFREAYSLLNKVDRRSVGQVDFYLASYFINQWDYQNAIPFLNRYCRNKKISSYQKLVGRLNRFAGFVSLERFDLAENEFQSLIELFEKKKLPLLLGNLLEIRSQMLVLSGQYDEAQKALENSKLNLKNADHRSALYVSKWLFILKLLKFKQSHMDDLQIEFAQIKEQARQARDWETFREIEFYWFKTFDRKGLKKIYWGSRFQSYKIKVQNLLSERLQDEWSWIWPAEIGNPKPLDPVKAARPKLIRKLLFLLSQELYSPIRSTELIDLIYTNEYFHPTSSPMKFARLIARARKWLAENFASIKIENFGDSFLLKKSPESAVVLHQKMPLLTDIELQAPLNSGNRFTSAEYAKISKQSLRTSRRKLQKLVQLKIIKTTKRGPRTFYQRLNIKS